MGSIDKACISGFLCRLCSEMHRTVIHIYGDQGQRLCLVEKINGYLPITISPTDPLPKTICETCLRRVEQHYDLLMRLSRIREEKFIRRQLMNERMKLHSQPVERSWDFPYVSSDDDLQPSEETVQLRNPAPPPAAASANSSSATTTGTPAAASTSRHFSIFEELLSSDEEVYNSDEDYRTPHFRTLRPLVHTPPGISPLATESVPPRPTASAVALPSNNEETTD